MKKLPLWQDNPHRFAHVSWSAEKILAEGINLPDQSEGRPCSLEGVAFAVSLHPMAWAEIARIGTNAPIVVVDFKAHALDFYKFSKKRTVQEITPITDWAVRYGWIKRGRDFLVWHWGGEEPEKRYYRFKEGDPSLEDYREELKLPEEEREEQVISIEEAVGWHFTSKLRNHVGVHYEPNDSCMEAEVLNLWLASEHPYIGMVWYNEILDPVALSAPRGAILPAHFKDVRLVEVASIEDWAEPYSFMEE